MSTDLLDLAELLDSWLRDLRAQRRSDQTQRSYRVAIEAYLKFCDHDGRGRQLTKPNVLAWLAAQHDNSTATVRLRLASVKLFTRWIAAQDETDDFDADAITAIKAPKLDQAGVPDLSDDEIERMLKTCTGRSLRDKRDNSIIRLLGETGLRAAELLAIDMDDINLNDCSARVRRGKGGKSRRVRFSPVTAAAIDKYVRARRLAVLHPAEGPLWISGRGSRLSYTGLVTTLKGRAAAAGVTGFHVHRLRHSAAVRWLRAGGTETGLRAQAGWSSNTMVGHYAKAAAEQLAAQEFERLNLTIGEP